MGDSKKHSIFHPYYHRRREYGKGNFIGAGDGLAKSVYTGIKPMFAWDADSDLQITTGGVFNLEFSPNGSLLVAACEKKCFQVFDPLTYKRIHSVQSAHNDCVNCVKFIDDKVFATCSDDTTINLWDIRNINNKIIGLSGHSSWVKNIEFSSKDKLLVTCGLDGSIYSWDINSCTENNLLYSRIFNAPDLMRCRLSPDSSQMVMCTTGGLLIIVHDLDLSYLMRDLTGFKPNLYRLMQTANQKFPVAQDFVNLFNKKRTRNRLEFISDFPNENDAAVVSSLQIHPQGWTALSRNISHDDKSEWTCVHNIQPDVSTDSEGDWESDEEEDPSEQTKKRKCGRRTPPSPPHPPRRHFEISSRPIGDPRGRDSINQTMQTDVWEAWVTLRQSRILQAVVSRGEPIRNFNMQHITGINTGITGVVPLGGGPPAAFNRPPTIIVTDDSEASASTDEPSTSDESSEPRIRGIVPKRKRGNIMRQNKERLLYYIEETNEGKGFIKELCYSSDGRVICSPFGHGIRLLSHDEECRELPHCVQENKRPVPLKKISESTGYHRDIVVSAKFNPRHYQLVTGCLAGKIVWYDPHCGEGGI